jgi:hypothetical protein
MKDVRFILNKTLIKSFYLQNAGFFLFLFLVFFGVIAPSQQPAYHYALIRGILAAPGFFLLVCLAWLLYALKAAGFVTRTIDAPENLFLHMLKGLSGRRCYRLLLAVQVLLFLPVWGYSLAISAVAWHQGAWPTAILVQVYIALICGAATAWYHHRLMHPVTPARRLTKRPLRRHTPYWSILLRYLFSENKALLAGIKIFGCAMLYALLKEQGPGDYDIRMACLAYSLALFGHGMLLYRCRELEATRLLCYRALPVSVTGRFGHYALFCLLLLLPEMLVLGWLAPFHILVIDALELLLSGYTVLLLLNSVLAVIPLRAGEFLKLCLVIFGIWYGCVLGGQLIAMSGFFFFTAAILFFRGYSRYEFR